MTRDRLPGDRPRDSVWAEQMVVPVVRLKAWLQLEDGVRDLRSTAGPKGYRLVNVERLEALADALAALDRTW